MDEAISQGWGRMDWGFGNPNKTAALIVLLMLAVWVLPYARKWSFWISLFAFVALGICLVLTESRGGIVGLMVGGIFLVAWAPRPFPRAKTVAVFVASWFSISL
jgi:hypothetical protein